MTPSDNRVMRVATNALMNKRIGDFCKERLEAGRDDTEDDIAERSESIFKYFVCLIRHVLLHVV